ncbi:hypothetical protein GALL_389770 [mine drainage metagenome]|uniref:Uncharacterized protein n=1 Tax=mine drainage metagenome TaxID=410659 RepID=A0A1J5Q6E4_9ZZZZ
MSYRSEAEAAHAEGFTYFDQLGGRSVEGGIELWLRVQNPTTFDTRLIKTVIADVDALESVAALSVADLWGGARWAEAEVAAQFRRAAASLTSSGGFPHPEEGE